MTALLSQQVAVFAFLFLLLVVGFLYKSVPKTAKEYALGSKKISTPVLMATTVATVIGGGSVIGHAALLYNNGLWLFFALFAIPVGYCIMALVIVPRLSKYYGCLSIVEIIGKMYGNYSRKIVGVIAFLFCLGILGAQIKVFYLVMESIFVDNALLATIIGMSIVTLYSAMGGASSVIKTGVIQFVIFIAVVPLVAKHIILTSGGITEITDTFSKIDRPFFHNGTLSGFIALAIFYLVPAISPTYCHRLLVGSDCKKNQSATYALAFVYLLTTIFLGSVAFIALSKFPNIEPQDTLSVVIKSLLPYEWAIVAFEIALVAIIVSTADALVNSGSIILAHDVLPSKITEKQKINLLRGITILSGIIALAFACFFHSVLDLVLFVSEYYAVIIIVPFIAGLFVKETSPEPFWASTVVGVSTFTMLRFTYNDFIYEAFLVGLIFSLIAYLSMFFAFRKRSGPEPSFSIRKLCDGIVEKHAIRMDHLGWLICLFFMLSVFVKTRYSGQYGAITAIEFVAGFLGCSLIFMGHSSLKYKNVMALFIIWYCFAFSPVYVSLHQEGDNVFTTNFIGSMVLLAGLFSWDLFLTSVLSGSLAAVLAFCVFGPVGNFIGPIMNLSLLLGYIALVAYFAFRKRELGMLEFVENKLKASNDTKLATRESQVLKKVLHASRVSLEASEKYRDILLHQNETIHVVFKDLKDNILAYFQQTSLEEKMTLTIINTRHKVLNTGLSLSFFYRTVYSLIANVFNFSKDGGEITVRFVCDSFGRVENIEISHVDYGRLRMSDIVKTCQGSYPDNILSWNILTRLFEQLEITVTETSKKLKITFPSDSTTQNTDNLIDLKEFLQTEPETV